MSELRLTKEVKFSVLHCCCLSRTNLNRPLLFLTCKGLNFSLPLCKMMVFVSFLFIYFCQMLDCFVDVLGSFVFVTCFCSFFFAILLF
ncbi:hypothetical protein KFK09_013721 [Dendrobium nobile]|uniref:Uncharacterized protein n=1 Tax=Dendrobium nobile TaxID=94219 RepID=A0A8T3B9P5_DENNO|nr:hypothetical protein KFK09_013721 [Dendrobium nobile]